MFFRQTASDPLESCRVQVMARMSIRNSVVTVIPGVLGSYFSSTPSPPSTTDPKAGREDPQGRYEEGRSEEPGGRAVIEESTVYLIGFVCFAAFVGWCVFAAYAARQSWKGDRYLAAKEEERRQQRENPNLMPCMDCGHLISKKAVSCPNCGRPLNPPHQP